MRMRVEAVTASGERLWFWIEMFSNNIQVKCSGVHSVVYAPLHWSRILHSLELSNVLMFSIFNFLLIYILLQPDSVVCFLCCCFPLEDQ